MEARLAGQRFLFGERLTEADWRLFTTLIRFDPVYFGHFKCNLREIRDYPALQRYLRELYHWPKVAETVDFFHIKHHYYASHLRINPTGIVPLGPELELYAAGRSTMGRRGVALPAPNVSAAPRARVAANRRCGIRSSLIAALAVVSMPDFVPARKRPPIPGAPPMRGPALGMATCTGSERNSPDQDPLLENRAPSSATNRSTDDRRRRPASSRKWTICGGAKSFDVTRRVRAR